MSLSTNTTYKVFLEKLGGSNPDVFVGDEGELFYNPSSTTLKISDGSTPGGVAVAGGGGGSQTLNTTLGLGNTSSRGMSVGVSTFNTVTVGGATTALVVIGDARITGILTIGTASLTLDGTNNTIKFGSGTTISESGGATYAGIITATAFIGGGSDLRNLSGTHLVSYASASDISNSALSIAGISTYSQVGILTGSLAVNSGDQFAASVATSADGKTIIVGAQRDEIGANDASGVVYVYDRVGNSFNQVGILTGSLAGANDKFGYSVATSADGKTIVVGAFSDEIGENTSTGVVYVYDRVGSSFNQVGILTGSLAVDASDQFGNSVATSADGKTIIVGAYFDEIGDTTNTGVVYVFDRVGNSFNQVGIVTGSLATNASDSFGQSVATSADGKTIVGGASNDEIGAATETGIVYVFDRVGNSFNQVGILTGSLATNASDNFGYGVAASSDGKTIIVSAYLDETGATTSTGVVYVFDRVGSSFNQVGILTGSLATNSGDIFGDSIATSADGKTIIVGAAQDEIGATSDTGVVYVFDRVGNSFNQVGILTGSLAVDSSDQFGKAVATSADGKTIIVSAGGHEIGATNLTGVVYVYDRVGSSFNQVGILTGSLAVDFRDNFGNAVATSADGKTIIVGAAGDEIGGTTSTGIVYVFDRVGSSFNQVGILTGSLATNSGDIFGDSIATSADGKTIIVGAAQDEIGATSDTGVVYVFDRVGNSFNQVGILTGSLATNSSDIFGNSVATSADGKTIIVGAAADEIGATTSTGVVYVFNRQGNSFNQVGILTGSLAVDASDGFGGAVATSADGKTIVVGALQDEIGATTSTGVVYVFDETRETYVHSGPTGNIGIGTTNPLAKLEVQSGDIRVGVNTSRGLILTAPNGTKYRLIVDNSGAPSTVLVP